MKKRGRPRVSPIQLRNGFYIEVCLKGVKKGVKIKSESRAAMEEAAGFYATSKDVIILGEYKSGLPFMEIPVLA